MPEKFEKRKVCVQFSFPRGGEGESDSRAGSGRSLPNIGCTPKGSYGNTAF